MPQPTGLAFGKQVGTLLAAHNLMIPGKPHAFSPQLARHFFLLETVMRPASDALYFAHSMSCYFSYPNRTDLVSLCSEESRARLNAQMFWARHLSPNYGDPQNMAVRGLAAVFHCGMLVPWFMVSACLPGMVHQALATAAGVTSKKYEATSEGAPGPLYNAHIAEMARIEQVHSRAASTTYVCPFTCFLAWLWFLLFRGARGRSTGPPPSEPTSHQMMQQQQQMQMPYGGRM